MQTSYTPSYEDDRELDSLYEAITGRRAFSYEPGSDPLYRSAADRFVQNGRMAMRDAAGQAAALTGGYGSSYAQSVGQQQYGEYLRSLSEALPQYYRLAYQRYSDQGQALRDAYDLAWQRREADYRRDRDAAADAQAAEALAYSRRRDGYQRLYQLISATGYDPAESELAAAGMSRAQADALLQAYLQTHRPRAGRGSAKQEEAPAEEESAALPRRPLMRKAGGVRGGKRLDRAR